MDVELAMGNLGVSSQSPGPQEARQKDERPTHRESGPRRLEALIKDQRHPKSISPSLIAGAVLLHAWGTKKFKGSRLARGERTQENCPSKNQQKSQKFSDYP